MAGEQPCNRISDAVAILAARLTARGETLAAAESCTGGLIAAECTALAGSSDWFERGFTPYSNVAKQECLAVDPATIRDHGAVSAPTVAAMLVGVLAHSHADHGVAVSGVAGPGGGSADKPIGTVFIGWITTGKAPEVVRYQFGGDRAAVRRASVLAALSRLCVRLGAGG